MGLSQDPINQHSFKQVKFYTFKMYFIDTNITFNMFILHQYTLFLTFNQQVQITGYVL